MTEAIGDVGDQLVAVSIWIAKQAVDGLDDDLDDVYVLPLVEVADVAGLDNLRLDIVGYSNKLLT